MSSAEQLERRVAVLEAQVAQLLRVIAERDATIAERDAMIAELTTKNVKLEARVAELEEKLGQNSSNSNKPPSSDGPAGGSAGAGSGARSGKPSGRKPGGQPGHRGSQRVLLPAEEVDEVVDCFPPACECCARRLPRLADADALRRQVTEVPPVKPHTTEYRQHGVGCTCGHVTRGKLPDGVSSVSFGPRLITLAASLVGVYKLSRRAAQALLWEMMGVRMSLGAISTCERRTSDALEPAHDEAFVHARDSPIKHIDATSWYEAGKYKHVWTLVTAAATVFQITSNGTTETVRTVLGRMKGILVSDRATAFLFWKMHRRQICWAHLLRKFVAFSERDGDAGRIGRELLDYATLLFSYWHQHKEGKLSRRTFRLYLEPIRARVEALLRDAGRRDIARMSGSCRDMLEHREALWTFVDHVGVEPTNNDAERALRAAVIWRKTSLGTKSERGSRFVERILTVTHTLRQHGRDVLGYIRESVAALMHGRPSPPLLPAHAQ